MEAEATVAMSRHIVTAFSALLLATAIAAGAASGGTSPGKLSPANVNAPVISGTAQVGQTLRVSTGTWSGKSIQYSYSWLGCDSSGAACGSLSGATGPTLTLTSANVGRTIRAVVIATNRNGSAAATSAATAPVTSGSTSPPPPPPPPPSGSSFYLSDLSWISATNGWGPVERNLSNGELALGDGHTITLNGQTFAKGLGVHAASDVRFGVAGCTRFLASVGVDDEVGPNGSVLFQVYSDGTKTYDSGLMTATSPTGTVDLDLTGKSEVRLVVGNGGDGIDSDHADWAAARVTCAAAPAPPPPSQPVSPAVTSGPTISGSAQQGQTLTAAAGTWSGATPMSYSYQWQRCDVRTGACSTIAGANAASYLAGFTRRRLRNEGLGDCQQRGGFGHGIVYGDRRRARATRPGSDHRYDHVPEAVGGRSQGLGRLGSAGFVDRRQHREHPARHDQSRFDDLRQRQPGWSLRPSCLHRGPDRCRAAPSANGRPGRQ